MKIDGSLCSKKCVERFPCWRVPSGKWLLLCSVVILICCTARISGDGKQWLPLLQLLTAPTVIFIFSRLQIGGVKLPLWVLVASGAGVIVGAILTYSHIDLARGAFVVARLDQDEFEQSTKIFRDRVRKTVGWRGLTLVGTHSGLVTSESEAHEILIRNSMLGGVIWGTPRWLNVTLQTQPQRLLFDGAGARCADDLGITKRLRGLQLITSVPSTGLSSSEEYPTVEFLGELAVAWQMFTHSLQEPASYPEFEAVSRSLAGIKGSWTAFSHRAVPMWMTGTYYLRKFVTDDLPEEGDLQCAIRALGAAFSQLRENDNPPLKVAILNNQALAYLLRSRLQKDRTRNMMQAGRTLKQALVYARGSHFIASHRDGDVTGLAVVEANLELLKATSLGKLVRQQRGTRAATRKGTEQKTSPSVKLKRKRKLNDFR